MDVCVESNVPAQYYSDSVFCRNGEAEIFTTQMNYINPINFSYCSQGHLFKLLPTAILKLGRWHSCKEQETNVNTTSQED